MDQFFNTCIPQPGDICPDCRELGLEKYLRYFKINLQMEQILKCESDTCLYPHNDEIVSSSSSTSSLPSLFNDIDINDCTLENEVDTNTRKTVPITESKRNIVTTLTPETTLCTFESNEKTVSNVENEKINVISTGILTDTSDVFKENIKGNSNNLHTRNEAKLDQLSSLIQKPKIDKRKECLLQNDKINSVVKVSTNPIDGSKRTTDQPLLKFTPFSPKVKNKTNIPKANITTTSNTLSETIMMPKFACTINKVDLPKSSNKLKRKCSDETNKNNIKSEAGQDGMVKRTLPSQTLQAKSPHSSLHTVLNLNTVVNLLNCRNKKKQVKKL